MQKMSLKVTLQRLSEKHVIPADAEERNYLLRLLGYNCIRTFYQLDNLIAMMFLENKYLVAPWEIKVRYCDPVFKVALTDIYFQPIDTVVPMWLCIDSIVEAGKAPLISEHNRQLQDMAFMCESQESTILSCMFFDTVNDENGDPFMPELSFHIQYVLDVIFGLRGYNSDTGMVYVATSLDVADNWRKAIVDEGKKKMKKVLSTQRYKHFLVDIDSLEEKRTGPVQREQKEYNENVVLQLASKL
jgi:hypothetical protein